MIKETYMNQGRNSINARQKLLDTLLEKKRLPDIGWDDLSIEFILYQLSLMDSNNFQENAGVGEREGRLYSNLVQRRHYSLAHGIGRSGDIAEVQPKAAGSSLILIITNLLALHAIRLCGVKSIKKCLVLPLATGMSLSLCLLSFRSLTHRGKYVIWPRIDQKSCFKCILTAGFVPLIVEPILQGDELITNIEEIRSLILGHNDEVYCVLSTTSCFAPRVPDSVDKIAKLCKEFNKPHIINNAYGIQCHYISKLIERALSVGRVDYVVMSTDKNFLVPVGGAVVGSPSEDCIDKLATSYPGRASSSPIVDLFITLLSMGQQGLQNIWTNRRCLLPTFIDGLDRVARKHNQRLLICPHNSISIGITLNYPSISSAQQRGIQSSRLITFFGSMLFQRLVSGARVIDCANSSATIGGLSFVGWGASTRAYPVPYLTMACAVGATAAELETALIRLDKVFSEFYKQRVRLSLPPVPANDLTLSDVITDGDGESVHGQGDAPDRKDSLQSEMSAKSITEENSAGAPIICNSSVGVVTSDGQGPDRDEVACSSAHQQGTSSGSRDSTYGLRPDLLLKSSEVDPESLSALWLLTMDAKIRKS